MDENFISIGDAAQQVLRKLKNEQGICDSEYNHQKITQAAAHFRANNDDEELGKSIGF